MKNNRILYRIAIRTSPGLSLKFAEAGCEFESIYSWDVKRGHLVDVTGIIGHIELLELVPTYDILNDICVKYAKEFFGEQTDDFFGCIPVWRIHPQKILSFLQIGEKQEAEEYIWDHCLFNPKNK